MLNEDPVKDCLNNLYELSLMVIEYLPSLLIYVIGIRGLKSTFPCFNTSVSHSVWVGVNCAPVVTCRVTHTNSSL